MDIPANTKITACYLTDSLADRAARRDELLHDFGFVCSCAACAKSIGDLALDEHEIRRVVQLRSVWEGDTYKWAKHDAGAMKDIDEALRIMNRQQRVDGQGEIIQALFQLHAAWGRRPEAIIAAQRVLDSYRLTIGKDAAAKTAHAEFVKAPELVQAWIECVAPAVDAPPKVTTADGGEDEEEEEVFEFQDSDEDEEIPARAHHLLLGLRFC
jgi:hypothetical protein